MPFDVAPYLLAERDTHQKVTKINSFMSAMAAYADTNVAGVAAIYDAFDDRYLGSKAADPTLDNDGNALLEGALYWNSTVKEMRVYNSSAWVAAGPSPAYLPLSGGTVTGALSMQYSNAGADATFNVRNTNAAADSNAKLELQTNNGTMFIRNRRSVGDMQFGVDSTSWATLTGTQLTLTGTANSAVSTRAASGNSPFFHWAEDGVANRGVLGFAAGSTLLQYRHGADGTGTGTQVLTVNSGGGLSALGNTIIGSTSVAPDGTLHVHTATAGTVTANSIADDVVVESSGTGGISILVPDANDAILAFGSPSDNYGAFAKWNWNNESFILGTHKAGGVLRLYSDLDVDNIAVSGGSGSELLTAVGDVAITRSLRLKTGAELTITSGVITAVASYHPVDTEADAASDDLDTINAGTDGDIIILAASDSGRTVVVKDGTGNIAIEGDFTMDNAEDLLVLRYNSALSKWVQMSRNNSGA